MMRLGSSVGVVVALRLVACGADAPPRLRSPAVTIETPVWIDGRFPPPARDGIERALGRWNAALGGEREFVVASDELDRPRQWLGLADHPMAWGVTVTYHATTPTGVPDDYLAQVFGASDVHFYADHFTSESYEWVALHELGHVLGLDDNEPHARLMSRPIDASAECIDTGTIAAVAHRRPSWAGHLVAECP